MVSDDSKEYELIRQEMLSVKECMTNYVGFVIGGAGIAVYGILKMLDSPASYFEIAFTCFVLSLITSFVLLILFYKFNSHNRFAGYCKLLNLEKTIFFKDGARRVLFTWELCIERLRASDENRDIILGIVDRLRIQGIDKPILRAVLDKYLEKRPSVDRHKFLKGCKILIETMSGKYGAISWGFPPLITSIFLIIILGFLAGAAYGFWKLWGATAVEPTEQKIIYSIGVIVTVSQLFLWNRILNKLYSLMDGASRIEAYVWIFLPIRTLFLNQYNISAVQIV